MKRRDFLTSPEEQWRLLLVDGVGSFGGFRRVLGHLPSAPRCKVCNNPFQGPIGTAIRAVGHAPSRKNPNLCRACFERTPPGGIDVDVAVLFADVRGSTQLGEHEDPCDYAALMNRFYRAATKVLVEHDAVIDKLIGDEVMALFLRGVAGPDHRRRAAEAGVELLRAVGEGSEEGPWLSVGVGVHAGTAFVGNVGGDGGVVDFTALGDPVNVAARLQSLAGVGEIVVGASLDPALSEVLPGARRRTVELRGHREPIEVLVHRPRDVPRDVLRGSLTV